LVGVERHGQEEKSDNRYTSMSDATNFSRAQEDGVVAHLVDEAKVGRQTKNLFFFFFPARADQIALGGKPNGR